MDSVTSKVTNFINHDVSIRRGLTRGFVNVRALAVYIQRNLDEEYGLESVISAVRRYSVSSDFKEDIRQKYELTAQAKMSSRTRMCSILLKKETEVRAALSKIYALVDFSRGYVVRTLESSQYIKVIVDDVHIEKVQALFQKSQIIEIERELGEISLLYDTDVRYTPGLFAVVTSELGLHDIAIRDGVLCGSEYILIVAQDDVVRAVSVLDAIRKWSDTKKKK
ncbi:hypothetical protein HYV86_06395 [Candidatus Woesearchaeota archaeon]|nr:hypothetical protein [Candidatus Woesearchaeota archaeon]